MRTFLIASLLLTFLLGSCVSSDSAPDEPESSITFSHLFDERGIERWELMESEEANFALENEVLRVTGNRGWLRSPRRYVDFVLRLDFRFMEPGSDSGIFVRAGLDTPFIFGWPGDSNQIQVRDISENTSDNPLPLANIYRHGEPEGETLYNRERAFELYTGLGEWQHYEITVLGSLITVRLNGEIVTTARDIDNLAGYIGFQSERGIVEYRNIEIYEL